MIEIKFKNLKKSELTRESVIERVMPLVAKFPDLAESKIQITLEMENSPSKAGPDHFKVKFHLSRGRYRGLTVEKSNLNLYVALADVIDHMLEALNRYGDRARVKQRRLARQLAEELDHNLEQRELKSG